MRDGGAIARIAVPRAKSRREAVCAIAPYADGSGGAARGAIATVVRQFRNQSLIGFVRLAYPLIKRNHELSDN